MFEFPRHSNNKENIPDEPEAEKISPEKERLLGLEQTGNFVFHGSPDGNIDKLEPRQPVIGVENKNHGSPRVAAAAQAEIAIFRSIINESNFPGKGYASGFGARDGKLYFEVSDIIFRNIGNKEGYVYIMLKSDFEELSTIEFGASKSIKPIEVIRVTSKDLPSGVIVMHKQ